MNERLRKQLYTYKRGLENRKVYTGVYTIILLFTIVVYGFFGMYPLVSVTRRKIDTLNELATLNNQLLRKKASINDTREALNKAVYYTNELNNAIPLRPEVESYMVGLVDESGGNGYTQRNFYIQNAFGGEVSLRARLQGSANQFPDLMADVEALHRLTKIDAFRYTLRENTASVELQLSIYYLER